MYRLILIGDQITSDSRSKDFAFYDTVTDSFIQVGYDQVWSSQQDFEESADSLKSGRLVSTDIFRMRKMISAYVKMGLINETDPAAE